MTAVMAMSMTSSPKRRPFGHHPRSFLWEIRESGLNLETNASPPKDSEAGKARVILIAAHPAASAVERSTLLHQE